MNNQRRVRLRRVIKGLTRERKELVAKLRKIGSTLHQQSKMGQVKAAVAEALIYGEALEVMIILAHQQIKVPVPLLPPIVAPKVRMGIPDQVTLADVAKSGED